MTRPDSTPSRLHSVSTLRHLTTERRQVEITVDGNIAWAWEGETALAALVATSGWRVRSGVYGASFGSWCGMGVCFACLITVNGQSVRACLHQVRGGDTLVRVDGSPDG